MRQAAQAAELRLHLLRQPSTVEKLAADSAIGVGGTPAEFARFIAAEQQRWKVVAARAKIKPD